MSVAFVQSVWTVIAMVVFIGIVIWAYSSRRKKDFEQASHIVQDDDRPVSNANNRPEE
jgi:cytochrome c oxidase cbb3-type subunit 4